MARYLDPKNDLVFKKVFGEHPDLLKSFLNALMPLNDDQLIETVEYLSPENVPDNPLKKFSVVDVRCKDNYGRKFIVEMQMQWSNIFPNRMLLNITRTFSRQANRGESYDEIQSVYGLGILNSTFDHKTEEYYHRYQMANCSNTGETIEGIEIVMVELPKFKPETINEKRMAVLWLRFLKETKDYARSVPEDLQNNKDIQKALEICEESAFSDAELETYDRYWMDISTEQTLLHLNFKEGLAKGRMEGEAKGRMEGLAKGRIEGEAKAFLDVATNLLKLGLPLDDIVKSTGLTAEEIRKRQDKL